MSGYLKLANGACVAIEAGFVLGRVAGCNLVIDDGKASRRHAKFHVEAGVVEIEDLQSSNGTLLNEKPVTRRMLRDGDRIQIGKTVLVFHEGAAPGSAAAARTATNLDDNDLFGDGPTMVGAVVPLPPPTPAPPPPAPVSRPVVAAPVPPPKPAPVPAPAPAPTPAVVEFADEVVEVRKSPPPASAAAAASKPSASTPMASGARILQYQKKSGGGGLLGDDLAQVGGGMRALLVLGVLALGAGIVYGIVVFTS